MTAETEALRTELAAVRAELAETVAVVARLREEADRRARSPRFAGIYPAFEDRFRGAEADIRDRLSIYLSEVRAAVRHGAVRHGAVRDGAGGDRTGGDAPAPRVLDLGPGRGEWLAMLAEAGIAARGVEDNTGMVTLLRGRGLDVVAAEALAHLGQIGDGMLDVVTAFHVVEHLDLEAQLELLAQTARVVRPGGLVVLETPNPTNLVMGACNFYLDPTHRTPIPPARLAFLATASGFTDVVTWELHPKERVDLGGLRLDGVHAADAAIVAAALQKGLFGPQDYALLLRTPV